MCLNATATTTRIKIKVQQQQTLEATTPASKSTKPRRASRFTHQIIPLLLLILMATIIGSGRGGGLPQAQGMYVDQDGMSMAELFASSSPLDVQFAATTTATTTSGAARLSTAPPSILQMQFTTLPLRDSLGDSNEIDNSYAAAAVAAAAAAVAAVEADIAFEADVVDDAASADVDGDGDVDAEAAEAAATDYVMAMAQTPTLADTTNEATTTTVTNAQQQRKSAQIQDLLSLSLLSSNPTSSASTPTTRTQQQQQLQQQQQQLEKSASGSKKSISSGGSLVATSIFQQIGSQQINALVPATAATVGNGNGSQLAIRNAGTPATTTAATPSGGSGKSNARNSAKKVESKYILPKQQKTDAPMLNYIFDTFSSANKHHHHDQRYGPHFEDAQRVGQPTNMTVQAGSSVHLNCRISLLQDKTVSWVRRNAQVEGNSLDLLTVGLHAYTGDKRYKMEFQYPNNWRLKIINVKKDDEAMYECQISTHPPRVIQINLHVNAPKVMIVDEYGDPLQEKYYEIDSTLQLSCVVRNVAMSSSVVYWKHGDNVLNYDVTRGGVSVKTELMDDGANSTLFIAKINKSDSGNYTCSISDFQNFTVVVHILNGESFAELHHGGASLLAWQSTVSLQLLLLLLLFYCSTVFACR